MIEIERLERLEQDVRDIKAVLERLEPMIIRIDERLSRAADFMASLFPVVDGRGRR
jgi:hypothetical protein